MKNNAETAKPLKKPATRPWDKKHDSSRPWRPDYLRLAKKHAGFHPRFVRREKVDLWKMRGYEVAKASDWGIDDIGSIEGKPMGSHVQRAELVLMEIPAEMFQRNQKLMDERIKASQRANKAEVRKELAEANRQLEEAGAEPSTLVDETEGIR